MSEEAKGNRLAWASLAVPAVTAAYALSAGPALRLCDSINPNPCASPAYVYRAVYEPLFEVAQTMGLDDALRDYVGSFRNPNRGLGW